MSSTKSKTTTMALVKDGKSWADQEDDKEALSLQKSSAVSVAAKSTNAVAQPPSTAKGLTTQQQTKPVVVELEQQPQKVSDANVESETREGDDDQEEDETETYSSSTNEKRYRPQDLGRVLNQIQFGFFNKKDDHESGRRGHESGAGESGKKKYLYNISDSVRRTANSILSKATTNLRVLDDIGAAAYKDFLVRPARQVDFVDHFGKTKKESNEVGNTGLTVNYSEWNNLVNSQIKEVKAKYEESKQRNKSKGSSVASTSDMTDSQFKLLTADLEKRLVQDQNSRPYKNDALYVNKMLTYLDSEFKQHLKSTKYFRDQLLETTMQTPDRDAQGAIVRTASGQVAKVDAVSKYEFYNMGIMSMESYEKYGEPEESDRHPCYQLTIVPELKRRYNSLMEYISYMWSLEIDAANKTYSDARRERTAETLKNLFYYKNERVEYVLTHLSALRRTKYHRDSLRFASFNNMSDAYKTQHNQRVPDRTKGRSGGQGRGRGNKGVQYVVVSRAPRGRGYSVTH